MIYGKRRNKNIHNIHILLYFLIDMQKYFSHFQKWIMPYEKCTLYFIYFPLILSVFLFEIFFLLFTYYIFIFHFHIYNLSILLIIFNIIYFITNQIISNQINKDEYKIWWTMEGTWILPLAILWTVSTSMAGVVFLFRSLVAKGPWFGQKNPYFEGSLEINNLTVASTVTNV